ncbi:MAG: 50S ribosomal protein L35 [Patescibacteria group bacterium]
MPKLKTSKTTSKRIHTTGGKKLMRRYTMQDHFNARERGKNSRAKRRDRNVSKTRVKNLKRLMPYC